MKLYEILEIDCNASEKEIKKAYHKLALLYHPDKNKDINAKEKFQNIQTAYQILSNEKTRINYCQLNQIQQHNFVDLLQKIFKNSLVLEEIKHFGIYFEKQDWKYLESNYKEIFNALNFQELLIFFKEGKFPKKKIDTESTVSDTDNEEFASEDAETYYQLPVYYQRNNNLDINLNLNIDINDLISNNKRKIKIKRTINNNTICNTFVFTIDKPYIVYSNCGDINENNTGNLIIKLNLPSNYYWNENLIIIEKSMSVYEMVYGIDIKLNINDKNINILKWVPSRDGFYIDINEIKIKNLVLTIKLVLNYDSSEEKKNLLLNYFS